MGRRDIVKTINLMPISLVHRIIAPISWVANVKFEEEPTVKRAQRIKRHGIHEGHPRQAPFLSIVIPNFVRDKNNRSVLCTIAATNCGMDGTMGTGWVGVAGGGPVAKIGSIMM
jgi:hypothetical protein